MGRKRSPEYDYICIRCGCAASPPGPGAKHVGGGQNMRACRKPPMIRLRSEWEAELAEDLKAFRAWRERS